MEKSSVWQVTAEKRLTLKRNCLQIPRIGIIQSLLFQQRIMPLFLNCVRGKHQLQIRMPSGSESIRNKTVLTRVISKKLFEKKVKDRHE